MINYVLNYDYYAASSNELKLLFQITDFWYYTYY